ncbi:3-oxoacyl-[acyl-carrier-protein] synthase [Kappamyces sp. JEL0680]|nr:3-oxoacyl-[acyl-carrier-protein] synthase [Kappamyces sp. JEL0680]
MSKTVQFSLFRGELSCSFFIAESLWIQANSLKDAFQTLPMADSVYTEIGLLALWIKFLSSRGSSDLVAAALAAIHDKVYPQDIHVVVDSYDDRDFILATYYQLYALAPKYTRSAVLASPKTRVVAMFGGQGPNEEYLAELQVLFDTYPGMLDPLLAAAANVLDLDVVRWLSTKQHPPTEYSASVPVSLPLIGVTQLCQYYIACKILNLLPGEMRSQFRGASGHSQGIVSAVVVSVSDTFEAFVENFVKGIRLLSYIGKRAQEALPKVYLDAKMVADCAAQEGSPSYMLSINGIDLAYLQKTIAATNSFLGENCIAVSLFNGPKNFVVTGLPKSLYGLVLALRKAKAAPSEDQSKIPFSKRKPQFSMRFLPVHVPFHSAYLEGCTALVWEHDVGGSEYWHHSELAIPVYHTESGADLRSDRSVGLTQSICRQIFSQAIHWQKVSAAFPSPTHIIDFGPGGQSGIGPLTARNLEGTGVAAITMGRSPELYDTVSFVTLDNWASKWSPKLVKDR